MVILKPATEDNPLPESQMTNGAISLPVVGQAIPVGWRMFLQVWWSLVKSLVPPSVLYNKPQ